MKPLNPLNVWQCAASPSEGYRWYQLDLLRDSILPLDHLPDTLRLVTQLAWYERECICLCKHSSQGATTYIVMLGPLPTSQKDYMQRPLRTTLVVEFQAFTQAAEFFTGCLNSHWPIHLDPTVALADRLQALLRSRREASPISLTTLLPQAMVPPKADLREWNARCLYQSLSLSGIQAMRKMIRAAEWVDSNRQPLQPLLLVVKRMVPGKITNVWRALTDATQVTTWTPHSDVKRIPLSAPEDGEGDAHRVGVWKALLRKLNHKAVQSIVSWLRTIAC